MEWQPIETAPKYGTRVLVFTPVDGIMVCEYEGQWMKAWMPVCDCTAVGDHSGITPTHWMPLPDEPC